MVGEDKNHEGMERLARQVEELEEQVKKLLAGELTQYHLQAKLDRQRKTQTELLKLSEKLQNSRNEAEVGRLVAEALVESFDFEKAIVCMRDQHSGNLSVVGLDGYYDDVEAELVRKTAATFIESAIPDGDYIKIHSGGSETPPGMGESVTISCGAGVNEQLGYISFGTSEAGVGSHHEIDPQERSLWETIAGMTSVAIENARLYNQLATASEDAQRARNDLGYLNERLERMVEERTRELAKSEADYRKLYMESKRTGELYRTLLDASPDPIVVYDIQGKPTYINPAFTRVFGWAFEELEGRKIAFVPSENWPETREMIEKVMKGESFSNEETRRFTKDGRIIDVSISGAIYFDGDGNSAGSVIHLRDITDRKMMEEDLLKIRKLESVGLLAGGIAHDFNNILSGILMNAQLARLSRKENDRLHNYLRGIERATQRAVALTQQLLTFSKGGAPVMKTASIGDLIRDSAGFALRGSNVRSEFFLPHDLWPVEVDESQIDQVIRNLVLNADQAMPEGGTIRISGENIHVTQALAGPNFPLNEGRYVKFSIEDRGRGIPREDLPHIFDPYFTTKEAGTGLGLATTFSIIAKHGGHITVESEAGKGAVFHIYLPASEKETTRTVADPKDRELAAGIGRILLMDDEDAIRTLANELLASLGYEVETAEQGAQAIDIFKSARALGKPFDVVIMDLTVPGGMGGREAVSELLRMDPDVKAIVSSGYSNDPIMADYRRYGFSGVVTKPYGAEELIEELHRVLGTVNNAND